MTEATNRTHYQALGVSRHATDAQIRSAYRTLARSLHPDRFMDASAAERALADRRMREVNSAMDVLGSRTSRRAYDESSASSATASPSAANMASGSPSGARSTGARVAPDGSIDFSAGYDGDDVEMSRAAAFLLRRGPIILVVFVMLVLLIGTAYAGTPGG